MATTTTYLDAAAAFALARLRALAGDEDPGDAHALAARLGELAVADPALVEVWRRFGVTEAERRVVELVAGVERSFEAARAARALSGAPALTVEVVREALGEAAERALDGDGRLRAHGLLVVGGAPGGRPRATADVVLAPGLLARLAGRAPALGDVASGVEAIAPAHEGLTVTDDLAALVRDEVLGPRPRWVVVGGARDGEAAVLALALARRLKRSMVLLDGRATLGLDAIDAWGVAAAARREADLRDATLVVDEARALGAAWRALAARPPSGATLPSSVVLVDRGPPPAWRPLGGFERREVTLAPEPATGAAAPPAAASAPATVAMPAAQAPAATADDGFESIRRQAALDVARAMGKPIDVTLDKLPAKAVVPRHLAATAAARAATDGATAASTLPPGEPAGAPATATSDPSASAGSRGEPAATSSATVERRADAAPASNDAPTRARGASSTETAPAATTANANAAPSTPAQPPPSEAAPPPKGRKGRKKKATDADATAGGAAEPAGAGPPATAGAAPAGSPDATAAASAPGSSAAATAPATSASAAAPAPSGASATASASAGAGEAAAPVGAASSEAVAATPAAPDPAESLPYLPVGAEPTSADLLQLLQQAPNPLQRAELLERLARFPKDVRIAATLRGYTRAEHPRVRAAAEAGMVALFGAGWNVTRAIPKPVQPPRTDDNDRGPPGGYR